MNVDVFAIALKREQSYVYQREKQKNIKVWKKECQELSMEQAKQNKTSRAAIGSRLVISNHGEISFTKK